MAVGTAKVETEEIFATARSNPLNMYPLQPAHGVVALNLPIPVPTLQPERNTEAILHAIPDT